MLENRKKRNSSFKPWSVDVKSGHCATGTDFHASFDPNPTPSGAIKAIGLFGRRDEAVISVTEQMKLATLAIEEAVGGYVVWGEYYDIPVFQELEISLLGEIYGFYPNLAMRSSLFFKQPCDAEVYQREWIFSDNGVSHRSNGLISGESTGEIDLAILHPGIYEIQLKILKSIAGSFFKMHELKIPSNIEGWVEVDRRKAG